MKKILILLLLAPTLGFAMDTQYLRDANYYCNCVITKPDDISYSVQDSSFVTFYTDLTATVETENYDVQGSINYSHFGPWMQFSNDCDSSGSGFAILGMITFKYLDKCVGLSFDCSGYRYWNWNRP